jgi:hypothetical protein
MTDKHSRVKQALVEQGQISQADADASKPDDKPEYDAHGRLLLPYELKLQYPIKAKSKNSERSIDVLVFRNAPTAEITDSLPVLFDATIPRSKMKPILSYMTGEPELILNMLHAADAMEAYATVCHFLA